MEKVVFLSIGLISLLTWNITINITTEYYIEYRLKSGGDNSTVPALANSVLNDIVIIAQAMIFVVALTSFFHRPESGKEIYYIVVTILVQLGGFLIFTILTFLDSTKWKESFIYLNYFFISVMQVASGWMQVSLFSMAGLFQDQMNLFPSIITGMNLCGIISTVFFILLIVADIATWKLVAVYYSLAAGMCVVGLFLCRMIKSKTLCVTKQSSPDEGTSWRTKTTEDLRKLLSAFKMCYPAVISTYIIYTVTLLIFPAVLRTSAPTSSNIKLTDNWYGVIVSFVIFNTLAFVTSPIPSTFKFPPPKYSIIPALLRIVLIPFFIYGNSFATNRSLPVVMPDSVFIICSIIFSLSHGYFSSLSAAYAPEYAPGYEREAGYLTSLCTSFGLLSGGISSKLVNYIITK